MAQYTATCPGCGAANPTDRHLMDEWLDLRRHGWGMFGHNADRARAEVTAQLLERGITEIPNIFGAIPVEARPTPRPTARYH